MGSRTEWAGPSGGRGSRGGLCWGRGPKAVGAPLLLPKGEALPPQRAPQVAVSSAEHRAVCVRAATVASLGYAMSLAGGRAPRKTAGNRLSGLLEAEEEDEFYQTTYGGFTEARAGPGSGRAERPDKEGGGDGAGGRGPGGAGAGAAGDPGKENPGGRGGGEPRGFGSAGLLGK